MRFSGLILTLLLTLGPASLRAEVWQYGQDDCNQFWFMRNLIMDRAGYCFGTPLGKAMFDNRNCTGTEVKLSGHDAHQVEKIRRLETQTGCRVDTSRSRLDVPNIEAILRLRDMPIPDNGGSACTWVGAPVPLYDGYGKGVKVIGQFKAGDRLAFGYIGEGDWNVLTVSKGGEGGPSLTAWSNMAGLDFERNCTDWAG